MDKKIYIYEGPVMQFGKVIVVNYRGGTQAVSFAKALANIAFTCKRKLKLEAHSKIELDPSKLQILEA